MARAQRTIADFLDEKFTQTLLPGAINKPQYNKLRYCMHILRAAEWAYDNPATTLAAVAALGLIDTVKTRILPTVIKGVATAAADYGLPALYLAFAGGALYYGYQDQCNKYLEQMLRGFNLPRGVTRYARLETIQTAIARQIQAHFKSLLSAVDAQADSVVGVIASTFTPESAEMWPGWISWIISVLGGSNPADSISDSDTRLILDSLERDITEHGVTNLKTILHCYSVFQKHGDKISYHSSAAKNQIYTKYQSILGQLAKHMDDLNAQTQQLYVLLDKVEEKLLLKPGTLTHVLDQMVSTLYHHLYSAGHSFGLAPSRNRERVYVAVPPFAKARREAAELRMAAQPRDEHVAYTKASRFTRDELTLKRKALRILEGESIAHLVMMTQDYGVDAEAKAVGCDKRFGSAYAARKLVRVAAVVSGQSQSRFLYEFDKGELTLAQALDKINAHIPTDTPAPVVGYPYPVYSQDKDTSIEAYFVRSKADRLARVDTLSLDQVNAELLQSVNQVIGERERYIKLFFALFGQKGILEQAGSRIASIARVNLAILQNEADRIFNNHHLLPAEREYLLQALIRKCFPVATLRRDGLHPYQRLLDYFLNQPVNHALDLDGAPARLPLTCAMQLRRVDTTPKSIIAFNALHRQLKSNSGVFDVAMIGKIKDSSPMPLKQAHKALNTLVMRIQKIAFSGVMDEAKKQQEICNEMHSVLRHLKALPYVQLMIQHMATSCFTAAQVAQSNQQSDADKRKRLRRGIRLLTIKARLQQAAGGAPVMNVAAPTTHAVDALYKSDTAYRDTVASPGYRYFERELRDINTFDVTKMNLLFDRLVEHYGDSVGHFARNRDAIRGVIAAHGHYNRNNISAHPMWRALGIVACQLRDGAASRPSKLTRAFHDAMNDVRHAHIAVAGVGVAAAAGR